MEDYEPIFSEDKPNLYIALRHIETYLERNITYEESKEIFSLIDSLKKKK